MTTDAQMEKMVDSLLISPNRPDEATEEPQDETEVDEAETEDMESDEPEVDTEDTAEDAEDDDDETEDDEGDEKPQTYRVKVDGREVEVTLEDLTRSYSGQAYINEGMQKAAETRKQVEAQYAALQAEQARFLEAVQQVQQGGIIPQPKPPAHELAQTDPIGYMQEKSRYDAQMEAYNSQQAQISQVQKQREAMQQQAMQQHIAEQRRLLTEAIPEYADPVKGETLRKQMAEVGRNAYGFSAEELSGITDARAVKVLHDAMRYQELISGKARAKKPPQKTANVKPKARVGTPKSVQRDKMRQAARKSGKIDDFVDLLLVQK